MRNLQQRQTPQGPPKRHLAEDDAVDEEDSIHASMHEPAKQKYAHMFESPAGSLSFGIVCYCQPPTSTMVSRGIEIAHRD